MVKTVKERLKRARGGLWLTPVSSLITGKTMQPIMAAPMIMPDGIADEITVVTKISSYKGLNIIRS